MFFLPLLTFAIISSQISEFWENQPHRLNQGKKIPWHDPCSFFFWDD